MRHHELADSLIQARTRRNIAGRAERKHLQGSKLEGGNGRLQPHAPARCLPRRRHRSLSGFTPRAVHGHLCAQYAYRVAPSPVQVQPTRRARLPPTIDHALLTSAASHPRCRLQVMKLAVTVATSRQCLSSLAHEPRQRPSPRHARHAHVGSVLIRRPAARSVRDGPTRSPRLRLRPSPADFGRPDLA